MNISITQAKSIRESLGATHLVIFAVGEDGRQHVATHGKTEKNAQEAADAGNQLKTALGWSKDLCDAKPLLRKCENCAYWKQDWGFYCFNGWSGDGSEGYCQYEVEQVKTSKDSKCHRFEPRI